MKFIKFFTTKYFWLNLLLMLVVAVVLVLVSFGYMKKYTDHNEAITVPDLRGMSLPEVGKVIKNKNLQYIVMDSSYNAEIPPAAVIDQSPAPDAKVKKKRKIYLTVNAKNPPSVKMPNVEGNSRRQAILILDSWGLQLGEEIFVPHQYENLVLEARVKGQIVEEGKLLPKGTVVDLVIGDGYGSRKVEVPDLVGLRLYEAIGVLQGISLNPGMIEQDGTVTDSLNAFVYYQDPSYDGETNLRMGEPVNLYITQNISGIGE